MSPAEYKYKLSRVKDIPEIQYQKIKWTRGNGEATFTELGFFLGGVPGQIIPLKNGGSERAFYVTATSGIKMLFIFDHVEGGKAGLTSFNYKSENGNWDLKLWNK